MGFFQLSIVLGILGAYVSNFLIAQAVGGELAWRLKLGVAAVPALLFFVLMLRVPQSPRWLFHRGRTAEARKAIETLSMGDPDMDVVLVEEGRLPAICFGIVAVLLDVVAELDRIVIRPPAAV